MKTVLHALIGLPALVGFMFAVEALPVDNNLGIESGNNDRSLSLEGITVKQPNGNLGAPHDANGERALGGKLIHFLLPTHPPMKRTPDCCALY